MTFFAIVFFVLIKIFKNKQKKEFTYINPSKQMLVYKN